jgi:hypothetical protein
MSFELLVFVRALPSDLIPRWENSLKDSGLECQFYPGYHPSKWHDNFAPVRVTIHPAAFPNAFRYGTTPLLSEITLDIMDVQTGEYSDVKASALRSAPENLRVMLSQANQCV